MHTEARALGSIITYVSQSTRRSRVTVSLRIHFSLRHCCCFSEKPKRVDCRDHNPGAAGARELACRAPGAIIIGGGCEFVLAFFETHSGSFCSFTSSRLAKNLIGESWRTVDSSLLYSNLRGLSTTAQKYRPVSGAMALSRGHPCCYH